MKQVLEPAGAAALAAVLHGRIPIADGERVASSRRAGTSMWGASASCSRRRVRSRSPRPSPVDDPAG